MTTPSKWRIATAVLVLCVASGITAAQTFATLANFDGSNGSSPFLMSMVQGFDGNYYGTTEAGGSSGACNPGGCGTVFKITSDGTITTLYSFDDSLGAAPVSGLAQGADGNFYGTASVGGPKEYGTVFKITPRGSVSLLHGFDYTDGSEPFGNLVQGTDGNLYGTTTTGVLGYGTIFRITPTGTLTTLHAFNGTDGAEPVAGLIQGADGAFYGTTLSGGSLNCAGGCGTVFRITSTGKFRTLHYFNSNDGSNPLGGVFQASNGPIFGTTEFGGRNTCPGDNGMGCGTVFEITMDGTFSTLYSFCSLTGCADGSFPASGLIQDMGGTLYGTTYGGGNTQTCNAPVGCGIVFWITQGGDLANLHGFRSNEGFYPYGGLLQATTGIFYGATQQGGTAGDGTIFSLNDGSDPFVAFVQAAGRVGQTGPILGQGFTGTTNVAINGIPAGFRVISDTYIRATIPQSATTGYVTVSTPTGVLTSNVPFRVIP